MIQRIGPVSIGWPSPADDPAAPHPPADWWVRSLTAAEASCRRGQSGALWFDSGDWSGVETASWVAWISNRGKDAAAWGEGTGPALREALSVVIPAILRRDGLLDGHGALVAPDPSRPDDGVFITGLSGSGKSTLAVACALAGARFVSDDSLAIGSSPHGLRGWSRRASMSLAGSIHRRLLPGRVHDEVNGKVWFDAAATFGDLAVDSLQVCSVLFLHRASDGSRQASAGEPSAFPPADAYRSLLMGHPILAIDSGARACFRVVRSLVDLPAFRMANGADVLENPKLACAALARLLPRDSVRETP